MYPPHNGSCTLVHASQEEEVRFLEQLSQQEARIEELQAAATKDHEKALGLEAKVAELQVLAICMSVQHGWTGEGRVSAILA